MEKRRKGAGAVLCRADFEGVEDREITWESSTMRFAGLKEFYLRFGESRKAMHMIFTREFWDS